MRQLLIGAVFALPLVFSALPANAMPVAPQTSSIVDAVTSDIIAVKGGHGHGWGHGWGRGHGHRAYGWGRGRIYSQFLVLLVVLDRRSRGRAKLAILDQDWKAP